jgi:hypothetical protein
MMELAYSDSWTSSVASQEVAYFIGLVSEEPGLPFRDATTNQLLEDVA